jgi:hypothetical protein
MATTDAKTRKVRNPASLKIERKRKTTMITSKRKSKLVIEQAKMERVLRKSRIILRRTLKKALKGLNINRIPDKTYKRIDGSIARNAGLASIIESAVVEVVNAMPVVQKAAQNGGTEPPVKKKRKTVAKTDDNVKPKKVKKTSTKKSKESKDTSDQE